jgi:2-polyprenyl-6-hydroxyphenyl methylase/3-demethylubiquinone-9 3-methyltransferase
MHRYYTQKLSAGRLRLCYELAPSRVKRYLEAEIEFVLDRTKSSDLVLELGCGYGRVLQRLMAKAKTVIGIDTSRDSLQLARALIGHIPSCHLLEMNAAALGFRDRQFDMTICIQNGISALQVNPRQLSGEAIRVTRAGGTVVFSSYAERFWNDRLEWFRIQSAHGLVGEIDDEATGHGVIVCKDGFRASTFGPEDFIAVAANFGITPKITEVDDSSIFCEIVVK